MSVESRYQVDKNNDCASLVRHMTIMILFYSMIRYQLWMRRWDIIYFEKCILDGPFGKRTRILVTHHLEVLPKADMFVMMEASGGEGRIIQHGTYEVGLSVQF